MKDEVTLTGSVVCDSASGLAFKFVIDDEEHWIPYSLTSQRTLNPHVQGQDTICVPHWWARRNGLAE